MKLDQILHYSHHHPHKVYCSAPVSFQKNQDHSQALLPTVEIQFSYLYDQEPVLFQKSQPLHLHPFQQIPIFQIHAY